MNNSKKNPEGLELQLAQPSDAIKISVFFRQQIQKISYYNKHAREEEIKHYNIENIKKLVDLDERNVIIAKDIKNNIIGLCLNRFDDDTIWLSWIMVNRKRKGIGKRLLAKLYEFTLQRGAHKVWCDCRSNNKESKAFLLSEGFVIVCEIEQHWYRQDFLILEKTLSTNLKRKLIATSSTK